MPGLDNFFNERTPASEVKANIVTKHFDTWSNIVLKKATNLGQKITYMDLYCGPGRYKDGTESTPLLVLKKAIAKPELAKNLITIFNDEDAENIRDLEQELKNLPGIKTLAYQPAILNTTVGQDTADYFQKNPTIPCFTFIDPFGYAGLTLNLIEGVTKNWGCDCIFFFNYDRINRALSSPLFSERMAALFGKERADALQKQLQGINAISLAPWQREEKIITALMDALKELNKGKTYPRPFRFKTGNRTTHMLVFVTKHPLGYRVMNDIMARQGYIDRAGVPSYTFHDNTPMPSLFESLGPLKVSLLESYPGRTMTREQIFHDHVLGRNFIEPNYTEALKELENEGAIKCDPPADKRKRWRGRPSFGPDTKVTFPARKS